MVLCSSHIILSITDQISRNNKQSLVYPAVKKETQKGEKEKD